LRDLVQPGQSRLSGSAGNRKAKEHIVEALRALGLTPQVQRGVACAEGVCAQIENVAARLPGRSSGKAVLLTAHYDSVAAGPGAGDDGAGVAVVLESARALAASGPHRNPIGFLLTDGEELGLLGARAFVAAHPWAADVAAVVNVEGRGSSGPSLLFETGDRNAWMVDVIASSVRRPMTSSAHYTVYKLLPNDTDFSVFRDRGWQGGNLAFIRGVSRYHTSYDRIEHLDGGSIQHHGDNALALVRALADRPLTRGPAAEAVYFDVLSSVVVWWPSEITIWLLVAAAVFFGAALTLRSRHGLTIVDLGVGSAGFFVALMLAIGTGLGLQYGISWARSHPAPWWANPVPLAVAIAASAVACATGVARWVLPRTSPWGLWGGIWFGWILAAIPVVVLVPGLSHLLVVPLVVAGLAGVTGSFAVAVLAPLLAVVVLWVPAGLGVIDAVGLTSAAVVSLPSFLSICPAVPELGRSWLSCLLCGLIVCGAGAAALQVPTATRDAPQGLNVTTAQEAGASHAQVYLHGRPVSFGAQPTVPPTVRAALTAAKPRRPGLPWWPGPLAVGSVAADPLPAPEVEVRASRRADRRELHVVSPRGATTILIALPDGARLDMVRYPGAGTAEPGPGLYGRALYRFDGVTSDGIELSLSGLELGDELWIADWLPGLGAAAKAVGAARPPWAVPFQDGDGVVVQRKVALDSSL
jgi:hypothetical protein